MRLLLFFAVVLYSFPAFSQIGFTGSYTGQRLIFKEVGVSNTDGNNLGAGFEGQLHYWFRLPNQRIEFQPTIFYGQAAGDHDTYSGLDYSQYGAQMEINIYPFDFNGDCGCPTFGKQGPQLQKGFFLQLSAGVARGRLNESSVVNAVGVDIDEETTAFIYGGGLGIDFGLTNFLTITPIATVRLGESPLSTLQVGTSDFSSRLFSYQLGLQTTFRFDYKKY